MRKLALLLLTGLLSACAMQSTPTGGEKDTQPPEVLKEIPQNKSINQKPGSIFIQFNEYVVLKSPATKIRISPPIKQKLNAEVKGKSVIIEIENPDSLLDETTYTISFSDAIQDLHENNPLQGYQYIFSTGASIDSGFVKGVVKNALSGEALKDYTAMLYPANSKDSMPFLEAPLYYNIADENGNFSIENVPEQPFKLFILKDENLDFKANLTGEELAFLDTTIIPGDSLPFQSLRSFTPKIPFGYKRSSQTGYGNFLMTFSGDATEKFEVKRPNDSFEGLTITSNDGDSVQVFYLPTENKPDSFVLIVNQLPVDTVRYSLRRKDKLTPPSFSTYGPKNLSPIKFIQLKSNHPIDSVKTELLVFVSGKDTIATPQYHLLEDPRILRLTVTPEVGQSYTLHALPHAFTDFFGQKNEDTLKFNFNTGNEETFANLFLNITVEQSHPLIFELLSTKGNVLFSHEFFETEEINIPYLAPGKYRMRVIWDENKNGKWDEGDYFSKKQAEWVTYYLEELDLRANWEIDLTWKLEYPGN